MNCLQIDGRRTPQFVRRTASGGWTTLKDGGATEHMAQYRRAVPLSPGAISNHRPTAPRLHQLALASVTTSL